MFGSKKEGTKDKNAALKWFDSKFTRIFLSVFGLFFARTPPDGYLDWREPNSHTLLYTQFETFFVYSTCSLSHKPVLSNYVYLLILISGRTAATIINFIGPAISIHYQGERMEFKSGI
jgi:hypothetical protein